MTLQIGCSLVLSLSTGHLPIPANFTTVGKPQIFVNQYDSPIEVYSEDTIKEMAENRLTTKAGDGVSGNFGVGSPEGRFDPKNSNVLGLIGKV